MCSKISNSQTCIARITHQWYLAIYKEGLRKQFCIVCIDRQPATSLQGKMLCMFSDNFEVQGKKGSYRVNFGDQSNDPHCTCRDWLKFHLPCKHFFAIFHHFPDWNWEKIPKHYLTSVYLSADSEAIAEYVSATQKSSAEHSTDLEDDTLQDHGESNYTEIPKKVCTTHFML